MADMKLVFEFGDGYQAEAFVELLEGEGIPASAPGLQHRGMLGMAGTYISVPVRVPEEDYERAAELLLLFQESPVAEDNGPYRDAAPERKVRSDKEAPRLRRIAIIASFICPGGGHFYARSYPAAWSLLVMMLVGVYAALSHRLPIAVAHLPLAVIAFDAINSPFAATRYNEERPWPAWQQLLITWSVVVTVAYLWAQAGVALDATVDPMR